MDLGNEDFHGDRVAALREVERGSYDHVHLELPVPALQSTPIGGGGRGRQDQRESQDPERDEQNPRGTVDPRFLPRDIRRSGDLTVAVLDAPGHRIWLGRDAGPRMTSCPPMRGRRTFGTMTEPSAC